jgi:hypothetical protein
MTTKISTALSTIERQPLSLNFRLRVLMTPNENP